MKLSILAATLLLMLAGAASAGTVFGSLSNFDTYNTLSVDAHGFQIEFDGLHAADVVYTFNYSRYGTPVISESGGKVYVRYESAYNSSTGTWAESTTPTINPTPTAGHQCVTGPLGNITGSNGCEHFGLTTRGNPLNENYQWLVASGPGTLGVSGSSVSLPAPAWSIAPIQVGQVQPVVHAVVQAPPEIAPGMLYGEAVWVKVFTSEVANDVLLEQLLSDDPLVPHDAVEQEVEWQLLQAGGPLQKLDLDHNNLPLGAGNVAVVRRYEYYKYTGAFDDAHQALDETYVPGSMPLSAGGYIGAQFAAIDLNGAAGVPEPASLLLCGAGLVGLCAIRSRRRRPARGRSGG